LFQRAVIALNSVVQMLAIDVSDSVFRPILLKTLCCSCKFLDCGKPFSDELIAFLDAIEI
tara:strand:- start:1851 stop:2030 length:180 start_codon:yes stop_codon:yes gene_type:complete